MDVGQLRGLQGTEGFLRTNQQDQTTTYGTNFLSRAVGWNQTRSDENQLLRFNFTAAIKREYGGTPEGDRFVKSVESLMNFESRKPLSLHEVKHIIERGDAMKVQYDQSTPAGVALRQLDQARGLATMLTNTEEPINKAVLRDQLKAAVAQHPGLSEAMEKFVQQEVASGKNERNARNTFLDKLMSPSVLYQIRSDVMAASNMGAERTVARAGGDPSTWMIGREKVLDIVASAIDTSGVLQSIQAKFDQIDSLPITSEARQAAKTAALEKPDQPVEQFMTSRFGDDNLIMMRAQVQSTNRAICDEYAPDPDNMTAFSGREIGQTREIFHEVLQGSDFRAAVETLNSRLPDGDKIKLYGGDDSFMRSLLPEIRENILARSDGGKHKVTKEEAESIVRETMTRALESKARNIDETVTAGAKAGLEEGEVAKMALKRMDGDFVSMAVVGGGLFPKGNRWAEFSQIVNETLHGREHENSMTDDFSTRMSGAVRHVALNNGAIQAAQGNPRVIEAFDRFLPTSGFPRDEVFKSYVAFNNQPASQILGSLNVSLSQVSGRYDVAVGDVVKEGVRGNQSGFNNEVDKLGRSMEQNERVVRAFAQAFTDPGVLSQVPPEHREALEAVGKQYQAVLDGMQSPGGLWQQMKEFVQFGRDNPAMAMNLIKTRSEA